MANNKVTIYIHNQRYRFLAEENEDYLQQCADIVNKEMDNAMDGNTLSITDGAVLAAMNVADKYCKERLVSDNLRPAEAGPGRKRPAGKGDVGDEAGGPQGHQRKGQGQAGSQGRGQSRGGG